MTTAATPMIMPRSVSTERSLCAQMAATASFNVSMNFMVRVYYGTGKALVASAGGGVARPTNSHRGTADTEKDESQKAQGSQVEFSADCLLLSAFFISVPLCLCGYYSYRKAS